MDHLDDEHDYLIEEEELQEIRGAFLNDTIAALEPSEPICLHEASTVAEAIARMLERRQAGVLIVDDAGRLAGVITDGDLRRLHLRPGPIGEFTARDFMTRRPRLIEGGALAATALDLMEKAGPVTSLVIVDDASRPVGVIHLHDILRAKIGF